MSNQDVAYKELLGGGLYGAVQSVFALMEVAEDEIKQAQRRHPDKQQELWGSFSILQPTIGGLFLKKHTAYKAHVRELLERIAAGETCEQALARPTDGEVTAVLSELSLVAPLNQAAFLLYATSFRRAYPGSDAFDDTYYNSLVTVADKHEVESLSARLHRWILAARGLDYEEAANDPFVAAVLKTR